MQVSVVKPSDLNWMAALSQLRHDIYQLPQYLQLEADRNHSLPEAIVVADGDSLMLIPYLLRRCNDIAPSLLLQTALFDVVSPYGYPGILLNESARQTPGFADRALAAFKENLYARGICSVFLRLHPVLNEQDIGLFSPGTFIQTGETVSVDLRVGNLAAHTRETRRHQINKCKKLNMLAQVVPFTERLDLFVSLYQETMARVHATQEYCDFNTAYFQRMVKLMGDRLHLCVVDHDGESICASLYSEANGIVQRLFAGTRDRFTALSPSSLEIDYGRQWAKERGNQLMHLGGGIGGSRQDGVYLFKAGFSKLRHPFYTLRMIVDETKYHMLSSLRAEHLGRSVATLQGSEFFPVYRSV